MEERPAMDANGNLIKKGDCVEVIQEISNQNGGKILKGTKFKVTDVDSKGRIWGMINGRLTRMDNPSLLKKCDQKYCDPE